MNPYLPRWTARATTDLGGRDPLGLSPVAHLLTGHLLTGIITTTERARYYAVYCWILWHIQETEAPQDFETYKRAFQRREAAFAVATVRDSDAEHGPVGLNEVKKRLADASDDVALQFQVLPSAPFGGYGANYSGCMQALRLWVPGEIAEEVTDGTATQLALAVHANLDDTPYIRNQRWHDQPVPLADIDASIGGLSLQTLATERGNVERHLITDALFGLDDGLEDLSRRNRRHTLALILWVVSEYERAGVRCPATNIEDHILYWPTYDGVLVSPDLDSITPCAPLPALMDIASQWQQFCAHGYLTYALERLLESVLSLLDVQPKGMTLDELVGRLILEEFEETLSVAGPDAATGPAALLAAVATGRERSTPPDAVAPRPDEPLAEYQIWKLNPKTPGGILATGVLTLAALHHRWRTATGPAIDFLRRGSSDELWHRVVLPELDSWTDPALSWTEVLTALLGRFVVAQHEKILYAKGRLQSCWLHKDAGRLHHDQDVEAQFRASRIPQAVSMLRDLLLLEVVERDGVEHLTITQYGRDTLNRALVEEHA